MQDQVQVQEQVEVKGQEQVQVQEEMPEQVQEQEQVPEQVLRLKHGSSISRSRVIFLFQEGEEGAGGGVPRAASLLPGPAVCRQTAAALPGEGGWSWGADFQNYGSKGGTLAPRVLVDNHLTN